MAKDPYRYIIFTDASFKQKHSKSFCGYGVIIINTETNYYAGRSGTLGDKSIVYGEGWAILEGIEQVISLVKKLPTKKRDCQVLVVTDSKLSVNILTKYWKKWDTSDWFNWKLPDGKPAKNQEIYRQILELKRKNSHIKFKFVHMHGHLGKKNEEKIRKDLESFGIRATDDAVALFRAMNEKVDTLAQSITDQMIEDFMDDIPVLERKEK